jgi:hypothetical protein
LTVLPTVAIWVHGPETEVARWILKPLTFPDSVQLKSISLDEMTIAESEGVEIVGEVLPALVKTEVLNAAWAGSEQSIAIAKAITARYSRFAPIRGADGATEVETTAIELTIGRLL